MQMSCRPAPRGLAAPRAPARPARHTAGAPLARNRSAQLQRIAAEFDAQRLDHQTWTPSTEIGQVMADPRNPVLYEAASSEAATG